MQEFLPLLAYPAKHIFAHSSSPATYHVSKKGPSYVAQYSLQTAEICLRILTKADFTSLADLWVVSWQEAMPGIDFAVRRAWFFDHLWTLEATGSVTTCAVNGLNCLIGFVTVHPVTGYLDQLAVAPGAKGSGVASLLLNEARRLSPEGIVLDVNEDNPRALAFYAREGFVQIAEGVNPYSGLKTRRLRWPVTG